MSVHLVNPSHVAFGTGVIAPRWLYVPIYIALGLAALLFLPDFLAASVPATVLILVGGVFYIAGAVIYGL